MTYQTKRINIRPYFKNKNTAQQEKVGEIELFLDYFKILNLNPNIPYKEINLKKARDKAISDYANDPEKKDFINKAYTILADNNKYEFELTTKNDSSDSVLRTVLATPREFYLQQRKQDFAQSSTDEMVDAVVNNQLTIVQMQEYIRDGADITKCLVKCITHAKRSTNYEILLFILDKIITKKDLSKVEKLKDLLNELLFDITFKQYLPKLLKNGADPNTTNEQGKTAADIALSEQDFDTLKILVDYGSDPEMLDNKTDETLLMRSASKDAQNLIKSLIRKGANLKAINKQGKTPIDIAREGNKFEIMGIISEYLNDPEMLNKDTGETLLMWAASKNAQNLFKSLLKRKANLNAVNKQGKTVTDIAHDNNKFKIMELISDHLSDTEMLNQNTGETLLMWAANKDAKDFFKYLLGKKANLKATNKQGKTAIDIARDGDRFDIMKMISEHLNDPEMLNIETGETLLLWAASKGADDLVANLLNREANPDAANKQGKNALYLASINKHNKILGLLVKAGAKAFYIDKDSKTITIVSSTNGKTTHKVISLTAEVKDTDSAFILLKNNPDALTALFEAGEDPDATDPNTKSTALMVAANHKLPDLVDLLLKKGANVNAINAQSKTALYFAYKNNDLKSMKALLGKGAKRFFIDPEGKAVVILNSDGQLLHKVPVTGEIKDTDSIFALLKNNPTALQTLFEAGENPDVADPATRSTALMVAANHKLPDLVDLLLKKGANVSTINAQGKTALYFAYKNNDLKSIKALLGKGAKPFFIDPEGKAVVILNSDGQLLHKIPVTGEIKATDSIFALLKGNPTALRALFEAGEDPDATDPNTKSTALMVAANHKLPDLVDLLLKKGANVNAINAQSKTALYFAYKNNDLKSMKALLGKGAKPFFIDPEGKAVVILNSDGQLLHKVLVTGEIKATDNAFALLKNNPTALKALFDAGESPDVADPATRSTALMVAANNKLPELVKLLLQKGAKVGTINDKGKTALHFAYKNNDHTTMKMLVEAGAEPFFIDADSKSVIILRTIENELNIKQFSVKTEIKATDNIFALLKNNLEALKVLFETGANPNTYDPATKSTALIVAAAHQSPKLIKLLLANGAQVSTKNSQGKNALSYAQDSDNNNIIKILTSYGKNPTKFILDNHYDPKIAQAAIGNLLQMNKDSVHHTDLKNVEKCLENLKTDQDSNLYELCGNNKVFFDIE